MNSSKKKIPSALAHCLWSYDVSSLDLRRDRWTVIPQVLNYGTWRDVRWLCRTYSAKVLRAVLREPTRGIWFPEVLNFWCGLLDVRLSSRAQRRAIMRLDPDPNFPLLP